MDHLGAGIGLLATIGNGDGIELTRRRLTSQNAGRILPGDRRASLHLSPADLRTVATAIGPLGDEVVDAALAGFWVAWIPVLNGGVFDLGIVQQDQLDHGRMKLVLIAHRGSAALQIGDVSPLIGNNQRAFELARLSCIDAEIGRQFHGAAHARRDVDKASIRKDC